MQTVDVAVVGMTMDVTGSNERAASLPRLPAAMAPLRKQQPGRCRGKFFFSPGAPVPRRLASTGTSLDLDGMITLTDLSVPFCSGLIPSHVRRVSLPSNIGLLYVLSKIDKLFIFKIPFLPQLAASNILTF